MIIEWTLKARADLERLYSFIAKVNPPAAIKVFERLVNAPLKILENPRMGHKVYMYSRAEVRRVTAGAYFLYYLLDGERLVILRVKHTREDRDEDGLI